MLKDQRAQSMKSMPSNKLSIRSSHVFTKTCFEIPRGLTVPDATNTQHNYPPPVRNKNAYLYHCITVMILMDFFKLFISHQKKCISNFLVQRKKSRLPPKKNPSSKFINKFHNFLVILSFPPPGQSRWDQS